MMVVVVTPMMVMAMMMVMMARHDAHMRDVAMMPVDMTMVMMSPVVDLDRVAFSRNRRG